MKAGIDGRIAENNADLDSPLAILSRPRIIFCVMTDVNFGSRHSRDRSDRSSLSRRPEDKWSPHSRGGLFRALKL